MYKLLNNPKKEPCAAIRLLDNATIPFDEANTDYQAYLKFLEDGGIPEPAEE